MSASSRFSFGGPPSLLESVIVILTSCSVVIFVFTITAKYLGNSAFDNLPDFLQDSYSAIWSAGAVAGGALLGSVVDALARREAAKTNFASYIAMTTMFLMVLIFSIIALSMATEKPIVSVPNGAYEVDLSRDTEQPAPFVLQNRFTGPGSIGGAIRGEFSVKDGVVSGRVFDSEIQYTPAPPGPFAIMSPPNIKVVSLHVCYMAAQNGSPLSTQQPLNHLKDNRQAIEAKSNVVGPQPIPEFTFSFVPKPVNALSPTYLCAMVQFENGGGFPLFW